MANLRCSAAEESEDTLNAFVSHTGYEPNLLTFGELNDSLVPFSFMIPSTDQDVHDVTLGEMLTAAHRGQVDYCVPGGMSVSQSSSSVMFDGSGQPDGGRLVDQSGKSGITLNVISAHSNFSEDIQIERMVDRSGKPDERNSSNAQIRPLLEVQVHCVNVVIGVVLGELHVVRVVPVVVCDDAVVRRTLVLIAFTVAIVFIVEFPWPFFCIWRCSVYRYQGPVGT